MYIRTTCGVLGILKHIKLNMYEFNNERYIKNGIRLHNSNHDYTIKLQEENLNAVLEDDDIIETNHDYRIKFVITHEQYIPLAQEVL